MNAVSLKNTLLSCFRWNLSPVFRWKLVRIAVRNSLTLPDSWVPLLFSTTLVSAVPLTVEKFYVVSFFFHGEMGFEETGKLIPASKLQDFLGEVSESSHWRWTEYSPEQKMKLRCPMSVSAVTIGLESHSILNFSKQKTPKSQKLPSHVWRLWVTLLPF